MRRALLAAAVLAVGAVAAFGIATAASGSSESVLALSEARVCGPDSFSPAGARCIVDQRAGLRSNVLHCSARAEGLEGKQYSGRFSFNGQRFPARSGTVAGDGWIFTTLRLPAGTFPAGRWACTLEADGASARVAFSTAGSAGTLTSAAACPTRLTVSATGVRSCREDVSKKRFAPTAGVTCSANYALAAGRTASVKLLHRSKPTGLAIERTLPLPVSVVGMQVTKDGGLPSGPYTCVFSLAGEKLGTRAFTIAPGPSASTTR